MLVLLTFRGSLLTSFLWCKRTTMKSRDVEGGNFSAIWVVIGMRHVLEDWNLYCSG